MISRVLAPSLLLLLLVGCTSHDGVPAVAADHPANPNVSTAPLVSPSATLAHADAPVASQEQKPHEMGGMNHSMEAMHGMHDTRPSAPQPTSQPATATTLYTCTMHPEVISDKPGKCPKCGMKLVEKKGDRR